MTDAGADAAPPVDFTMHEGGEVRLEWRLLPDGTTELAVSQAWFINVQDPEKLSGPEFETCSEVKSYLNTTNPSMDTLNSREYIDVGDSITLTSESGMTITMNKQMPAPDFRGHEQGIIYLAGDPPAAVGGLDPASIVFGEHYDIAFGNSDSLTEQLFMPGNWTDTGGNVSFQPNTPLQFNSNEDIVWQYDAPDEADANLSFLLFTPGPDEAWFCPFPRTGEITIPAAMVANLPPAGKVLGATLAHKRANMNDRNVDLLAMNCKIQDYTIVTP